MCQGTFHCCSPMTQLPATFIDTLFSTENNREMPSLAFLLLHDMKKSLKRTERVPPWHSLIPAFTDINEEFIETLILFKLEFSLEREVQFFNLHLPARWPGSSETAHWWCCSMILFPMGLLSPFMHQFSKELKTLLFSPDLSQPHCTAATVVEHRQFQPFLYCNYFKHINILYF